MGNVMMSGIVPPLEKPVGLPALSTVAVGSSVYLNENGSPVEYLVVHQGKPSSLYDNSCNGVWLLRKECYGERQWNSSDTTSYKASTIHSYLNNDFLSLFDAKIKSAIKQARIPYVNGTGTGGSVASGSSGLSAKVFLLSGYEVGWTQSNNQYFPVDGACLSYFNGTSATDSKRIAYLAGSAVYWWLRSPKTTAGNYIWLVKTNGYTGNDVPTSEAPVRPCLIMPSTASVDADGTIIV